MLVSRVVRWSVACALFAVVSRPLAPQPSPSLRIARGLDDPDCELLWTAARGHGCPNPCPPLSPCTDTSVEVAPGVMGYICACGLIPANVCCELGWIPASTDPFLPDQPFGYGLCDPVHCLTPSGECGVFWDGAQYLAWCD
ncbi:MAG: hypothetical protein CMJ84_06345 [Planctomycetes bacterium]|nr:hypothetical protein [Planctomycetota bacterium]